jgi:hypothetical protein
MGLRPSPGHWLFRNRAYQRSGPGNVSWGIYARQFKDVWQYLTTDELLSCQQHIRVLCERGGYDFDAGMNELYLQDLTDTDDPCARIHSWIKRYLPKILAVLKKQRGEIRFNDEVLYYLPTSDDANARFTPKEKTNGLS